MNMQNLRGNYPKLLSNMADNGYSKDYLHRLNAEINRILSAANSKNWQSYADIYTEYVEAPLSPTRLRRKRCLLGIIEHFDVRGQYPNGRRRHKIVEHSPLFSNATPIY